MKDEVLQAASRHNFWAFCCYYDWDFFRIRRPFLYEIAEAFQSIYEKNIKTLSVSMPPRAGKSYITSMFCAWLIGMNPNGSVMRNSCTATLYRKFSYDVRDILKSEKFKSVFPEVRLSQDKTSVDGWNVTEAIQVSYFGNGVGGTIIGFGASLAAITDDLYRSHEDVFSDTMNEKIHNWYDSAHKSRIEKGCPQIDIGTRWSETDVIGVKSSEEFYDKQIIVPALIDDKSFCEDVKSTEEYIKLKSETNEMIWDSEYMQQPAEVAGTIFPKSKLKRYSELNDEGTSVVYNDTADEGSDHYAAPIGKILNNKIYITDAIFNLHNLTLNEAIFKERNDRHKFDRCYIENNNAGAYYKSNIKIQNPGLYIFGITNTTNKMGRILAQSGWILENVYFPENPNPELEAFMKQMCKLTYKSKDNDDAADAIAGLAAICRTQFRL